MFESLGSKTFLLLFCISTLLFWQQSIVVIPYLPTNFAAGTIEQKATPGEGVWDTVTDTGSSNRSIDSYSNRRDRKEPKVILHLGPHKTGTSALQAFIHSKNAITFFQSDNVSIPPKHALPGAKTMTDFNFAHCMIRNYLEDNGELRKTACEKRTIPALHRYLTEQYHEGNDILIIAEDLDRFPRIDLQRVQTSLRPYKSIHIIMTYRRHVEWLLSWYHEVCRLYLEKFMKQEKFPSLVYWISKNPRFITKGAFTIQNILTQHNWTELQSDARVQIDVMHYHRTNTTLFQMMACDVLRLPNTCHALRNGNLPEPGLVRSSLAYLEGCRWMHKIMPPRTLAKAQCLRKGEQIANNLKQRNLTYTDLPLLRPSPDLIEYTWNITIAAEMRYRHYLLAPKSDTSTAPPTDDAFWKETRKMFDNVVQSKWWSLDLEKILKNPSLQALLPPI